MDLDKILKNVSLASSVIYIQKPFKIKPVFQYWVKLGGVAPFSFSDSYRTAEMLQLWEVPLISVGEKSLLQQIWFECLGYLSCSEEGLWLAPAPHKHPHPLLLPWILHTPNHRALAGEPYTNYTSQSIKKMEMDLLSEQAQGKNGWEWLSVVDFFSNY